MATNDTIALPFAIGVQIWHAGTEPREGWVMCPECAGTKVVTLTLGNGEQHSLDCANCSAGMDPPRGKVCTQRYDFSPVPFIPARVRVDGDEFSYSESGPDAGCYSSIDSKNLFARREDCVVACARLSAEHKQQLAEYEIRNLAGRRRNLAWSVHYWGSQVKRLERDLVVARERLARCKEKKGEPVLQGEDHAQVG